MSSAFLGSGLGQISDMMYRQPREFTNGQEIKSFDPDQQPGYTQPLSGMPQQPQQPQMQDYSQYYQQMRESMEGLDQALKELEGMQMPGGQYTPNPNMPSFGSATFGSAGK